MSINKSEHLIICSMGSGDVCVKLGDFVGQLILFNLEEGQEIGTEVDKETKTNIPFIRFDFSSVESVDVMIEQLEKVRASMIPEVFLAS